LCPVAGVGSGDRHQDDARTEGTPVANIKSQIKRNKQNEKRRLRNQAVRSELKTRVKSAAAAAETGAEDNDELTRAAIKRLDKAAEKGIIHKNQAARRKSRLMKRVNASAADVEADADTTA
jgi:small subunit ribosomal protein S20